MLLLFLLVPSLDAWPANSNPIQPNPLFMPIFMASRRLALEAKEGKKANFMVRIKLLDLVAFMKRSPLVVCRSFKGEIDIGLDVCSVEAAKFSKAFQHQPNRP